jgi:hypothetical protein
MQMSELNWNVFLVLLNFIEDTFFGGDAPVWVKKTLAIIALIIAICFIFWVTLNLFSKIIKLWNEEFLPLFYNADEKRKNERRNQFAVYIEREINRLDGREEWSDFKFTDLEAEVEAKGRRNSYSFLPIFFQNPDELRRESSLSKALESSQERLILLEGSPGSGKSVALRHLLSRPVNSA